MNTSKKIISLLMCMLMVLTMVPMSVFAAEATEIDTIHVEGVLAPQYGQTVEDHFDDMIKKGDDGEFKVNGLGYYVCDLFDDMGFSLLDKDKKRLDKSEVIVEGIYYFAMEFLPSDGYVIPKDVAVTLDGALSVETEFDEDGWLIAYAKFEVKATEIGTVHIEGIPTPLYGQTVKEYNTVMRAGSMNGTHKINGSTRVNVAEDIFYGNIELSDWEYYNSEKSYIAPSSADNLPSVYYLVHWLYPAAGYKFPDEVAVTVDGAVSVETELDEDGCLAVWAKFEVAPPTVIDTINIEGVFAPLYGQVPKYYLDDVIAKVKVNNEPYDSINQTYGNLNVEWQAIFDSTKANSLLSSSEIFSEGTYYYLLNLYPKTGFVFADIDDISASVNGNASVELKASTEYDDTVHVWVKLEVAPPTEIGAVHIEGVPAPVYGQTIKSYYEAIEAKITDGTITVNDEVYDSTAYKYGNLLDDGWNVRSEAEGYLSSTSTDLIKEGTYYVAMWFYPDNGYVIPEDVNVIFDGAKSIKIEVESDGCLDIRAEYEVTCPHTYEDVITKATLTTNGLIESKCSVCGDVKSTVTVYYPKTIKLSSAEVTYNGKVRSPSVTVKDSKGNTLVKGTDYDVTTPSGRKAPGQYTYTIKFKGNYSGEKKLTFTILPKAPAASDISATQSTSVINLKWKASAGATGYRVYQYSPSKGKFVLIASVKGVTSYRKATNLKAGTEYKFKIKPYTKLSDGTVLWGTASAEFVTATECKAPSITSVTSPSKSKATVKWSNVDGETGYQLYYSTKKDSGYKKVASYEANKLAGSKTFSSSASGKTIYFKVRAYHKVNGQTIFSEWSAVKSVKLK